MYYEVNEDGCYVLPFHANLFDASTYRQYAIASSETAILNVFSYNHVIKYSSILVPFLYKEHNDHLYEMALWCEENLSGAWILENTKAGIVTDEDAMAFKLKWC